MRHNTSNKQGVSPAYDISPTRLASSNDKGVLWQRHTMSEWHRNCNPNETQFITYGQLMEEKPYLAVKEKKSKDSTSPNPNLDYFKDYAEQSAIFSNRIITPELQPIPVITDKRRRPPRHLDPRIRGWDLNTRMWWPATVGPANLKAGQDDEKVASATGLHARTMDGTPRTPQRKSKSGISRQSSKVSVLSDDRMTPSPVSRAASVSASTPSIPGAANVRRRSQVSTGKPAWDGSPPAELLPEYVMKRGISMRYEKWVERYGLPEAPRLPFLTLHGDFRGADREYPVQVGSPVRPSGQCLSDGQLIPS